MNTKAQGVAFAILGIVVLFALIGLVCVLSRETTVTGKAYDAILLIDPPFEYPRNAYDAGEWKDLEVENTSVWRTITPRLRQPRENGPYEAPVLVSYTGMKH